MGVSSCNLLHTSMGFFTVHLFQGKGFSLVLGSALTKNCFLQAVWHHQTPSRGLFVCQGEESLMGTLKAKQIKRDWTRLPSPKKTKKQLYKGSCKITARQRFVCARVKELLAAAGKLL